MNIDNSNYDVYRLVLPVECTTFVNVYCRQSKSNYRTKQSDMGIYFTKEESLSIADSDYISLDKADCIIIHPTSSRPAHNPSDIEIVLNKHLLNKLFYILKPGAAVIIRGETPLECTKQGLTNFRSTALRWLKKPILLMSFNGYVQMLENQGFKGTRSFNVVSGWDNPSSIVSTDYTASKYFFSSYIESRRKEYTLLRYILLKSLINLNIFRYLESNFLVVAQK